MITELLAPAQRMIGERWCLGLWTTTQEHAAAAIVDELLGLLATQTPPPSRGRIAVVCAEGEWHITPARMAAVVWRSAGWDVTNLGGSTPPDHLRTSLELVLPDVVALSCTLPLALHGAGRVAAALDELDIPILAGGRAYGPDRHRSDALGIHGWAPNALQATTIIERWLDNPPTKPVPFTSDGEQVDLELAIPDLVAVTGHKLANQSRQLQSDDPEQRDCTREDLEYILRYAAVTLTVDDPRLFHDSLEWLRQRLTARRVPAPALINELEALADTITGLPRTSLLLSNARRHLRREWPRHLV